MSKNWKDVRDNILAEAKRIWFEEPEEVTMCKLGIYPSLAGHDEFVFGNLEIAAVETQAMSWGTAVPTLFQALDDPSFTLDHCKSLFKFMMGKVGILMGYAHPPQSPGPWLNFPKILEYYEDIVDSFDSIDNKTDFRNLIWVYNMCYIGRLSFYMHTVFPWEAGNKRMDMNRLETSAKLMGMKVTPAD